MKALIYKDSKGRWRWRVWALNGNILADGGQGYARRIDALSGLETVTGTKHDETRACLVSADRVVPLEVELP